MFAYLIYLSIYPPIYLSIYLSIPPSICLSIYQSIYLSIYLSIHLSTYRAMPIRLHIYSVNLSLSFRLTKHAIKPIISFGSRMVRPIFRSLVSSVTCCCLRILSSKMCYLPSSGHLSLMQFGFPIRNHLIQLTGICHAEKMHLSPLGTEHTHTHKITILEKSRSRAYII